MNYALFTGAAGGLAGACVEELAKNKEWTVFAADINTDGLSSLVSKTGDNVIPVRLDICSQESCFEAADKIAQYTDHLDVLVNAAGIHTMASLIEGDPAAMMQRMLDINVLGMIRVNKAMFDLIDKCKGKIINFSSECGREKPQPFNAPYAITKYAVEAYTMGLRRELNFLGIPVIKIQPGSFRTGMHGQAVDGYERILKTTTHYKDVLSVLKPVMSVALDNPHDKKYLVKTVMKTINSEHPKTNYRCKNTWYLELIDPIPDKIIDYGYRAVVGLGAKLMKKMNKY